MGREIGRERGRGREEGEEGEREREGNRCRKQQTQYGLWELTCKDMVGSEGDGDRSSHDSSEDWAETSLMRLGQSRGIWRKASKKNKSDVLKA